MKKFKNTMMTGALLLVAGAVSAASLSSTNLTIDVEDTGWSRDTGAYASTTGNIWNSCWFFHDGTTGAFADTSNFTGHTNDVTAGSSSNTANTISSTGITFGSTTAIAGLSATFDAAVTDDGSAAQVQYDWTFSNSTASTISLRVVWFVDGDISIGGGSYTANVVGFSNSDIGSYTLKNDKGVIGIGSAGTSGVNIGEGILLDSDTAPEYLFGLANSSGPSYWWSDSPAYQPDGVEAHAGIGPIFQDKVEEDTNVDFIADTPVDSGAAMQFELAVPGNGSVDLTTYLIFGLSEEILPNAFVPVVPAAAEDWQLYN